MMAVLNGSTDIVKFLLEAGADANLSHEVDISLFGSSFFFQFFLVSFLCTLLHIGLHVLTMEMIGTYVYIFLR
jgi:ankyrin repeat protein